MDRLEGAGARKVRPLPGSRHPATPEAPAGAGLRRVEGWTGPLLIRKSWDDSWGMEGYVWLPYADLEDAPDAGLGSVAQSERGEAGIPLLAVQPAPSRGVPRARA